MKYEHVMAEFYSRIWALREETLIAAQSILQQRAEGARWSEEEIRQRVADANEANGFVLSRGEARFVHGDDELEMRAASGSRTSAKPGSLAVIPIVGMISHRATIMTQFSGGGGTSIQKLTAQFRQAMSDPNCKAIVFDVDSPGGSVEGVMELASEIYNARGQKPITAVVNAMACSAAYWLASAAKEIVCTPSGHAGSIGVYTMHQDVSKALEKEGVKVSMIKAGKYKTEGNPSEPLSDEARAALQAKVDDYYGMFVKAVAQNRGASITAVRGGFGQGRSVLADDSVRQHLADRVATMDDVLAEFGIVNVGRASNASIAMRRNALNLMRATSSAAPAAASRSMERRKLELEMMRSNSAPSDHKADGHKARLEQRKRELAMARLERRKRELDMLRGGPEDLAGQAR